jgi:hypothetical protein
LHNEKNIVLDEKDEIAQSVGIATGYGLDGPGIETRYGDIPGLSERPT